MGVIKVKETVALLPSLFCFLALQSEMRSLLITKNKYTKNKDISKMHLIRLNKLEELQ